MSNLPPGAENDKLAPYNEPKISSEEDEEDYINEQEARGDAERQEK